MEKVVALEMRVHYGIHFRYNRVRLLVRKHTHSSQISVLVKKRNLLVAQPVLVPLLLRFRPAKQATDGVMNFRQVFDHKLNENGESEASAVQSGTKHTNTRSASLPTNI